MHVSSSCLLPFTCLILPLQFCKPSLLAQTLIECLFFLFFWRPPQCCCGLYSVLDSNLCSFLLSPGAIPPLHPLTDLRARGRAPEALGRPCDLRLQRSEAQVIRCGPSPQTAGLGTGARELAGRAGQGRPRQTVESCRVVGCACNPSLLFQGRHCAWLLLAGSIVAFHS